MKGWGVKGQRRDGGDLEASMGRGSRGRDEEGISTKGWGGMGLGMAEGWGRVGGMGRGRGRRGDGGGMGMGMGIGKVANGNGDGEWEWGWGLGMGKVESENGNGDGEVESGHGDGRAPLGPLRQAPTAPASPGWVGEPATAARRSQNAEQLRENGWLWRNCKHRGG